MLYLRRALWALWGLGVAGDVALTAVAILNQAGRLGGLAFFFGCLLGAAVIAMSIWSDEVTYAKPLPRAQRRELKRREAQLHLDAEIARLEKELRV